MSIEKSELIRMENLLRDSIRAAVQLWLPNGIFEKKQTYRAKNIRTVFDRSITVYLCNGRWTESEYGVANYTNQGTDFIGLYAFLFCNTSIENAFAQLNQQYQNKTFTFKPVVLRKPNFSIAPQSKDTESDEWDWELVKPIPENVPAPPLAKENPYSIYRDDNGERLWYWVVEDESNEHHCMTYWKNTNTGKCEWRDKHFRGTWPLYNKYKLSQYNTIIVAAKETAAKAAAKVLQGVATTCCWGVNGVGNTDWEPLYSKEVVIWVSKSAADQRYKQAVISKLWGKASIKIMCFSEEYGENWDATAAFESGWIPDFGVNYSLEFVKPSSFNQLPHVQSDDDFFKTCGRSLKDLMNVDLPPVEFVVDELITTDSLNLVSAWRGVGKSLFVMELALSISRGRRFFVWEVPQSRTTVVVDGEMGLSHLKQNYQLRCPQGRKNLYVVASDDFVNAGKMLNIVDLEIQNGLEKYFEAVGAKVVIFDNLSSLCCGLDENSNLDQERYLIWFRKLRVKGIVVVFVDHKGKKGEGPRGASKKEDWVSTSIELLPNGNKAQADFKIKITKSRGKRPSKEDIRVVLNFDVSPAKWEIIDVKPSANADNQRSLHLKLLSEYEKGEKISQNQIGKRTGIDQSKVSRASKKLRENGFLTKDNQLTDSGQDYLEELRAEAE